jgi:hypothetical protein
MGLIKRKKLTGFIQRRTHQIHQKIRPVKLGAAEQILATLRQAGCRDLVLVGPVRRPSIRSMRPDAEGIRKPAFSILLDAVRPFRRPLIHPSWSFWGFRWFRGAGRRGPGLSITRRRDRTLPGGQGAGGRIQSSEKWMPERARV